MSVKPKDEVNEIFLDWYRQRSNRDNPYHLIWSWQKSFQAISHTGCFGMRFMRNLQRTAGYCCHPFCPSCWHRKQLALLKAFHNPVSGLFYERSIGPYAWDASPEIGALNRLRARSTSWRLLGWSICFDAASKKPTLDDIQVDPFVGELFYYIRGIFNSAQPIKTRNSVTTGSVILQGPVTIFPILPETGPVYHWLDELQHPFEFNKHTRFQEYIKSYTLSWPTGKSWAKVGNKRL